MKFECEKNDEMQIKLAKIIGTQWKPHWSFMFITSSLNTTKKNKWNSRNSHLPVRVKSLTRAQFAHPATMDVPCWGNCANCAPKQTIGADQNKTNQICTRRRNKQMKTRENSPAALFFIFSKDFEGPDGSRLWPLHQPPFFTLNNRLPFLLLVHTKIINNK